MLMDKDNVTNIKLIWDCEFYYNLLTGFIKTNDNKISTLLSSIILRECTVFVMETMSYVPDIEEAVLNDISKLFRDSYPIIRDRIHYFTSQPFDYIVEKTIAENAIQKVQEYFLTRPVDDISAFRYDISYLKFEDKIYLSSIDISLLLEGTLIENNGQIIGPALEKYSSDLASIISSLKNGFSNAKLKDIIKLENLIPNKINFDIEFFNGKFDTAVERSRESRHLTVILLRFISDIGSLKYLVNKLFKPEWEETYYLYFFTRLIAIRFDEISDAIYEIENNFPKNETDNFISVLREKNIYPFPKDLRLIAKKLRNSIHYNSSSEIWNIDFSKTFYWYDNFLKQASTNIFKFTSWPNDYLVIKDRMLAHLELLHVWLTDMFDCGLKNIQDD